MKTTVLLIFVLISGMSFAQEFKHLEPGNTAIDFSLKTIGGEEVKLSEINKYRAVVLVILRGYPEYQCPICSRQVGSLLGESGMFDELDANLLLVYPGASQQLQEHATEFTEEFKFPENFYFVLDPDYSMINKYGLRWDAPKETAYPSTFVIDNNGKIIYSKISMKHGGRAKTNDVLEVLESL